MENKHKEFKPYDRVLVRDSDDIWRIELYSNWDDEYKQHLTLAYGDGLRIEDEDILPYEGNEYLVGTTDDPEKEIKIGDEYIIGISYNDDMLPDLDGNYIMGKIQNLIKSGDYEFFDFENFSRMYAIRFEDFNPSDMIETRKHILCVKNGKVVRYKE